MAAEVWNIEEIRERRLHEQQTRSARKFWGADGGEIRLAFERVMAPATDEQRQLVARLANQWEILSAKARSSGKEPPKTSLPPAA